MQFGLTTSYIWWNRQLHKINKISGICTNVQFIRPEHVARLMYGHLISNPRINRRNGLWLVSLYCCKFKVWHFHCCRCRCNCCVNGNGTMVRSKCWAQFKIFIFIYYAKAKLMNENESTMRRAQKKHTER